MSAYTAYDFFSQFFNNDEFVSAYKELCEEEDSLHESLNESQGNERALTLDEKENYKGCAN